VIEHHICGLRLDIAQRRPRSLASYDHSAFPRVIISKDWSDVHASSPSH
jgi:hypothetical protein